MQIIPLLIALFFSDLTFSQKISTSDNILIELLKAKSIKNEIKMRSAANDYKKESVREVTTPCKLEAPYKPVDVNTFSLVDKNNKLRYRITSIKAYQGPFPIAWQRT